MFQETAMTPTTPTLDRALLKSLVEAWVRPAMNTRCAS